MKFRVVVLRRAQDEMRTAYRRAAKQAPDAARRWFDRLQRSLQSLEHDPARRPRAREHGKTDVELHEFYFGKKPYVFRIVFAIEGDAARILRVRRAQRRPLTRAEIEESLGDDE